METNEHIQRITQILKHIGERIEGNLICDISPDNWTYTRNMSKINNLQVVCKDKKRIIEIGINACHSLLLMLLVNPTAEYLLFDLNNHKYTEPVLSYIKEAFPNTKIKAIFGDSVKTVTQYIEENPADWGTYDLCHLDGGHTQNIFSVDYENMKKLMIKDGPIIFDDYNHGQIRNFIDMKISQGEIVKYGGKGILENSLHFIYRYV
jgi:hypothetical protein